MAGGIITAEERQRLTQALSWPDGLADPGVCGTITLTTSVANVLNAADKSEVETKLNELAAKIDALLACRNL